MKTKIRIFSIILSSVLLLTAAFPSEIMSFDISADSVNKIFINEVCSSNGGEDGNLIDEVNADGSFCDWIELYNPNYVDVNLSGWGITDNKDDTFKQTLAQGTVIKACDYLIIYCSKTYAGDTSKSNVAIGLSSSGETVLITSPDYSASDKVEVPDLEKDTTYGRCSDGTDNFYIMNPTPGKTNNNAQVSLASPLFSDESGFYVDGFELNITSSSKNSKIYYTTDGSDPTTSDTKVEYSGSITIKDRAGDENVLSAVESSKISPQSKAATPSNDAVDKATVIRACTTDTSGKFSDVITKTYFVGSEFSVYNDVAVLSVATDYDNLYDYKTGIYVLGKKYDDYMASHPNETRPWVCESNATQSGIDWERECNVEFFDTDGTLGFSQECGIRIQGGASRSSLQKSFRFYARDDYGEKYFNYEIFPDAVDANGEVVSKYKTFVVRNGGNESSYLKYTDNYIQSLVHDRDVETQEGKACVVFLDGEYWGLYILQEDYDNDYFEQLYGIEKDEVVVYQYNVEEGTSSDSTLYKDMYNFIKYNSMADTQNYEKACTLLDMQSFIDYMSIEMYINNQDWPGGNFAFWRTRTLDESNKYSDGKWRLLLYDTEYSMGLYGLEESKYDYDRMSGIVNLTSSTASLAVLLNSLLKNADFKEQFVTSFMDIANVNFNSANAKALFDDMYDFYYPLLQKNYSRFLDAKISNINARYNLINIYLDGRPTVITSILKKALSLNGDAIDVTLKSNDSDAGMVKLNTTTVDFKKYENGTFSGQYISDYAIKITAQPAEGYKFVRWEGTSSSTDSALTLSLSEAVNLTAVFEAIINYGDINSDGSINGKDSLLLIRFIANYPVVINEVASDVDGDGRINSKDSLLLKRFIADWDVVLRE